MRNLRHFQIERDERGVITVLINVQGQPVNVFDDEVIRELQDIVVDLQDNPAARLVVFRSAKASGFFAGADIRRIQEIRSADEAQQILQAGQQLFDSIAMLPVPTVSVIHGPCLGGGLEFALSTTYRVARDDSETRLGLPEVQLGLLPAWGGTQRLPRTVGLTTALRMILESQKLSAAKAARVGLVDLSLPAAEFEVGLERFITRLLNNRVPERRRRSWSVSLLDNTQLGRWFVLRTARRETVRRGAHYPALPAAVHAIETGLRQSHAAGLTVEREEFVRLLFTPTSRNLVELFFQRERARKRSTWVPDREATPRPVHKVAVLGAGTMGAGIAQATAFSGYPVVLRDINDQLVAGGLAKINALMSEAVHKGALPQSEAETRLQQVSGTVDWDPLASADLVIEAVVEREDVKREVFEQLSARLAEEAVLASNTSSLSVTRLSRAATHPERVAGLHFFNPVHRMQLVEVVRTDTTNPQTIATLVDFVRRLGKVPVVVADSPGFLVNRVLTPYLDEAVRMFCEGNTVPEIDRQAFRFGMPMGPLELLDQVGLQVAADVAITLMNRDASPTPGQLRSMVERGWLGKKTGQGFYSYHRGRRGRPSTWIAGAASTTPATARPAMPTAKGRSGASELTTIQQRLILVMVNEAARCLEEAVVPEPWMIDLSMVLGTGFAPFRGGPLRLADALGIRRVVQDLEHLRDTVGERFAPCSLLVEMAEQERSFYAASQTKTAGAATLSAGR